jgi:hypothetical protein
MATRDARTPMGLQEEKEETSKREMSIRSFFVNLFLNLTLNIWVHMYNDHLKRHKSSD